MKREISDAIYGGIILGVISTIVLFASSHLSFAVSIGVSVLQIGLFIYIPIRMGRKYKIDLPSEVSFGYWKAFKYTIMMLGVVCGISILASAVYAYTLDVEHLVRSGLKGVKAMGIEPTDDMAKTLYEQYSNKTEIIYNQAIGSVGSSIITALIVSAFIKKKDSDIVKIEEDSEIVD